MGWLQNIVSVISIVKECRHLFNEGSMLFNNKDYYYKYMHRKTFVKSDGSAVIFFEQLVHIINPDKCNFLTVDLDVSDAQDCCEFPEFKDMTQSDKRYFEDYKFECQSNGDIIGTIREDYSHLPAAERHKLIKSKKFISIKIPFKKSHLKAHTDYKITYAFSIPYMCPIVDGKFGGIEETDDFEYIESWISCGKRHKELKYSLYLSNEILLHDDVISSARLQDSTDFIPKHIDNYDFLMYNKYVTKLSKAYKYGDICIKWKPVNN